MEPNTISAQQEIAPIAMPYRFIYQTSDWHIRDSDRDRLSAAIDKLAEIIAADVAQEKLLVVVGDIFHCKTRLSAQNIEDFSRYLSKLCRLVKYAIIIPGNHDANLNNTGMLDLLSPITSKSLRPAQNLYFLGTTGISEIDGVLFHVYSPLSSNENLTYSPVPQRVNIALLHDFISGFNYQPSIYRCSADTFSVRNFTGFTAVMCGHVHDSAIQDNIVYAGSLIQLDIGSTTDKGFIRWTQQKRCVPALFPEFVPILSKGCQVRFDMAPIKDSPDGRRYTMRANGKNTEQILTNCVSRVLVYAAAGVAKEDIDFIGEKLTTVLTSVKSPIRPEFHIAHDKCSSISQFLSSKTANNAPGIDLQQSCTADNWNAQMTYHAELITMILKQYFPRDTQEDIDAVISLHADTMREIIDIVPVARSIRWNLLSLEWSGLFCYDSSETNFISFENLSSSLLGVLAPNRAGKSAIFDILMIALFNCFVRGSSKLVLNTESKDAFCRVRFSVAIPGAVTSLQIHDVYRRWNMREGTIVYRVGDENHTCETIAKTYEEIERTVGTADTFLATALSTQEPQGFFQKTDHDRRELIMHLLGWEYLKTALSRTNDRHRLRAAELQVKEAEYNEENRAYLRNSRRELVANEQDYARQLKEAKIILDAMEHLNYVAKPKITVEGMLAEISEHLERREQITREIVTLTKAEAAVKLKIEELSVAEVGKLSPTEISAEIKKCQSILDTNILSSNPPAKSVAESEHARISVLLPRMEENERLRGEIVQLVSLQREIQQLDARLRAELAKASASPHLKENAATLTAAEKRQSEAFDAGLPSSCAIAKADATADAIHAISAQIAAYSRCAKLQPSPQFAAISTETLAKCRDALLAQRFLESINLQWSDNCADCQKNKQTIHDLAASSMLASGLTLPAILTELERRDAAKIIPADFNENVAQKRLRDLIFCERNHDKIVQNAQIGADLAAIRCAKTILDIRAQLEEKNALLKALQEKQKTILSYNNLLSAFSSSDAMRRQLEQLSFAIKNAPQILEARAAEARITELHKQFHSISELDRAIVELQSAQVRLSAAKENLTRQEDTIIEANDRLVQLKKQIADYNEMIRTEEQIRRNREKYESILCAHSHIIADIEKITDKLSVFDAEMKSVSIFRRQIDLFERYEKTLDAKYGIPNLMLARAFGDLQQETNNVLRSIVRHGSNAFTIKIQTSVDEDGQPLIVSKSKMATMNSARIKSNGQPRVYSSAAIHILAVNADGSESPIDLSSGYQRFVAGLAFRRALMRTSLITMPQFMILDEGFGCLDADNLQNICEHLVDLSMDLSFLVVISHIEQMHCAFNSVIPIMRTRNGGSCIKYGKAPEDFDISGITKITKDGQIAIIPVSASKSATKSMDTFSPIARFFIFASNSPFISPAAIKTRLHCNTCNKEFARTYLTRHCRSKAHQISAQKRIKELMKIGISADLMHQADEWNKKQDASSSADLPEDDAASAASSTADGEDGE
jgi:DNA repair exonuclease SbcCD ATPase subunit